MNPDSIAQLVRDAGDGAFERAFHAMEKVKERLERACKALEQAAVPYAVIGGNAVAAWVATVDDGAVRATRDVDILLRSEDLDRAAEALSQVGFVRDMVMDVVVFLDGADGKPSQGIHVLIAGRKVRPGYISPTPDTSASVKLDGRRVVQLDELVIMKLNSYRDKDRTHLRDMIQIGLIDDTWLSRLEPVLAARLQTLLNDPNG